MKPLRRRQRVNHEASNMLRYNWRQSEFGPQPIDQSEACRVAMVAVKQSLTSRSTQYRLILEMIFSANLLIRTKHSAFSTNHSTDSDKTKHNWNTKT